MCCVSLLTSSMLATGGILSVHNHHHTPVTLPSPSHPCHPPIPITQLPPSHSHHTSTCHPPISITHLSPFYSRLPHTPITNPPHPHISSPTPLTLTSHHQPPSLSHPITNPPHPHIPSPTPLTLTSHHQPPSPSPTPSWTLDGPRSLRQTTSSSRRMHTSRMLGKSSRVALTR